MMNTELSKTYNIKLDEHQSNVFHYFPKDETLFVPEASLAHKIKEALSHIRLKTEIKRSEQPQVVFTKPEPAHQQ